MEHGPADPVELKRVKPRAKRDRNLSHVTEAAPRKLLNWTLDWREHFRRFVEEHGGNPVEVGGRLVLPDGWSHSATDYRGPEWPPPTDPFERTALLASYWTERRSIVAEELRWLTAQRKGLVEAMTASSVPLMVKVKRFERGADGATSVLWDRSELSLDNIDDRLRWLAADVEHCGAELENLRPKAKEPSHVA